MCCRYRRKNIVHRSFSGEISTVFLCIRVEINDVLARSYRLFPKYIHFNAYFVGVDNQNSVTGVHSFAFY